MAPTGIDYLHLVADRHTRALGEQLQYAHLSDPSPSGPASTAAGHRWPTDDTGLPYESDLLALAAAATTGQDHDLPLLPAPDLQLEAELDSFAALPGPDPSAITNPTATTEPKESQ